MENEKELKFKKGDKVKMYGCYEASLDQYKDRIWTCRTDSYIAKCGEEVVFLEDYSGFFSALYLIKVNVEMKNNLEKRQKEYARAINIWGTYSQMEMALEKTIELSLAIKKVLRNNNEKTLQDLVGEVADVKIMIEQIELIMEDENFSSKVYQVMDYKINRLRKRLDERSFEALEIEDKVNP